MASGVDWTQIIVAGIGAFASVISACIAAVVYMAIRVPSGGRLAEVVERAHDLSFDTNEKVTKVVEVVNGQ